MSPGRRSEFHTHTFHSDGELLPLELIRRASMLGIDVVAITDHAGSSNLESVISMARDDCEMASEFGVVALPGVELTHVPPQRIAGLAKRAKRAGARLVIVHGETIVEPVAEHTNALAVECAEVDILAHPGLITPREAERAGENGVFLEITSRRGHSLTNGHVARVAVQAGARLLVNSDAHAPGDLMGRDIAWKVALGAGLDAREVEAVLDRNARELLKRATEG